MKNSNFLIYAALLVLSGIWFAGCLHIADYSLLGALVIWLFTLPIWSLLVNFAIAISTALGLALTALKSR